MKIYLIKTANKMLEQGYGIIPNSVLFSDEINDKQKLLYCLISSLCAEKGYCRAKNEYLGEKLNASGETISKNIGILVKKGFVGIELMNGNERKITLVENDKGGSQKGLGGVVKNDDPYIYTNNTIEYTINDFSELFKSYYGVNKGIDEKVCTKLINLKLMQGITLDQIKVALVLYNSEFRVKGGDNYKYVKKFDKWIKEFQPLNDDQIEETLTRIVKLHKERKKSDPKYGQSIPAKTVWRDLCETFGAERVNAIFKSEGTTTVLHFT